MIIDGNKLTPDECKWLYNGEVCSDLVYLGKNANADDWAEIDHFIELGEDAEASADDYEEALGRFGV